MKVSFIVATPLQVLICMAILRQLDNVESVDVFVVGYFDDAEKVCARLNENFSSVAKFRYFLKYRHALTEAARHGFDKLFIHWDIGFRTNLALRMFSARCKATSICVFEEGIGTYRNDIYRGFKKRLFRAVGLPLNIGAHGLVDCIYLYEPCEYLNSVYAAPASVVRIAYNVSDLIAECMGGLIAVFDPGGFINGLLSAPNEKCILYLTGWGVERMVINSLGASVGYKVLKLHPHIINRDDFAALGFDLPPNCLPAEVLISSLCAKFGEVEVYHHGSSVIRYARGVNINYIRI